MIQFDLGGDWQLQRDGGDKIPGKLPGGTYLDYMAGGMEDPFWDCNETAANNVARHEYTYSRSFQLPEDLLDAPCVELVADGLDTLCTLTLNGQQFLRTDNINRTWRADVKPLLRPGTNALEIRIDDPYQYIEQRQTTDPMHKMSGNGVVGSSHLRKTPCHFGWDWGPKLPPAGVIRSIALEGYAARISDLRIRQHHQNGCVELQISAALTQWDASMEADALLTDPEGNVSRHPMATTDGTVSCRFQVENPKLWWCNGLGAQPLYKLDVEIRRDGCVMDRQARQIGLRTIELDTAPLADGDQFRFVINGVPIFARGANWIPADSFITRVTPQDYDFYVDQARRANMNMLRVWGGGHYECEAFYDACDRHGILVWQDFIFACTAYPFHDGDFLQSVRAEVWDNVRRIRHRASLALWCGNNECEAFAMLWKKGGKERKTNLPFYHNILRGWVKELDGATAYWPGSPSGGNMRYKYHNLKEGAIRGDSHLWQIWHGMQPIEAFRNFPTRFCSEFGMESMPSMHTVGLFTDDKRPALFDPVMQLHQKSAGGNEKILFYLLAKYRNPAHFEDYVYLTQLVQANTIRFATDCWRRNMGKQNGALFWQLNDCWPVASWAGIDYGKQLKAVLYHARHFNKMLCLSNDYFKDRAELYVTNEHPAPFSGRLEWALCDFRGQVINSGSELMEMGASCSKRAVILRYKDVLKGRSPKDAALLVRLMDEDGLRDEKSWLLVPDNAAALPKVALNPKIRVEGGVAHVSLSSSVYARYVYLEVPSVTAPWSDNFFDIPAGQTVDVSVALPEGMTKERFKAALCIRTLDAVEPKNNRLVDRLLRIRMVLRRANFLSWLIFKFF